MTMTRNSKREAVIISTPGKVMASIREVGKDFWISRSDYANLDAAIEAVNKFYCIKGAAVTSPIVWGEIQKREGFDKIVGRFELELQS